MMSHMKGFALDLGSANTVGGTADVITVTLASAPSALVDGMRFTFNASAANTGATTLNVTPAGGSAFGAKKLMKWEAGSEAELSANEIPAANALIEVIYDSARDSANGAFMKIGSSVAAATTSAAGIVELATAAEAFHASSTALAVTPAGLANLYSIALNNAIEIADLKGSRLNMAGGIADAYDSETDVDTATSTNESYDAANDLYSPTSSGGGIDSDAKLVFHFDGSNGSTTFTDSSASAKTFTAAGNAQISTAQAKFGGASMLLDGSGDYLSKAYDTDFDFTADFTIDCWIRTSTDSKMIWNKGTSTGALVLCIGATSFVSGVTANKFGVWLSGGTTVSGTTTVTDGAWHHVAVSRSGSTVRVFVDGALEASGSVGASLNANATAYIGSYTGSADYFNGYIDEFRVTNGVARWTTAFTPPTSAYSSSTTVDNMTLVSNAFTATAVPTIARIATFIDPQESITINTDFTAEASRDGGTTWTAATLALVSNPVGTVEQYEGTADISGQPSDSDMKYRLKTLNNKDIDVTGTVFQWS
jgi:hypothetical protein